MFLSSFGVLVLLLQSCYCRIQVVLLQHTTHLFLLIFGRVPFNNS